MSHNPGNTHPLRKRLIQEIFAGAARQFDALEHAKALIDQAERLLARMNDAGRDAGQQFEADVRLGSAHLEDRPTVIHITTYGAASVPDVLGTILRAGLNYGETYGVHDHSVAIRIQGFDVPVVVYRPVLDCLEAA